MYRAHKASDVTTCYTVARNAVWEVSLYMLLTSYFGYTLQFSAMNVFGVSYYLGKETSPPCFGSTRYLQLFSKLLWRYRNKRSCLSKTYSVAYRKCENARYQKHLKLIRNVGNHPQDYTASQFRRPPLCRLQILRSLLIRRKGGPENPAYRGEMSNTEHILPVCN
jgi:hypothetical protein